LRDLLKLFKDALANKDSVVVDPYDYALLTKILPLEDAVRLYNEVTVLTEEEKEEGDVDIEDYEVVITFNERLFKAIIKALERYAKT
jgi:hypothetical protein